MGILWFFQDAAGQKKNWDSGHLEAIFLACRREVGLAHAEVGRGLRRELRPGKSPHEVQDMGFSSSEGHFLP
jgi:hypothetical protein